MLRLFFEPCQPSDQDRAGDTMAEATTRGRKILVAVDEGEESTHALSWSLKNIISENSRDTVVVLYVKPPRTLFGGMDGTGRRQPMEGYLFSTDMVTTMDKYTTDVAEGIILRAKNMVQELQNVNVETKIECGDPRDVICQETERLGADLLILGTHGHGRIKRAFLGSVSSHCAQKAKCPVLIVKRPKLAATNK